MGMVNENGVIEFVGRASVQVGKRLVSVVLCCTVFCWPRVREILVNSSSQMPKRMQKQHIICIVSYVLTYVTIVRLIQMEF